MNNSICIGWPTIKKLAKDGAVTVNGIDLIAADGLFRCNIYDRESGVLVVYENGESFTEDTTSGS